MEVIQLFFSLINNGMPNLLSIREILRAVDNFYYYDKNYDHTEGVLFNGIINVLKQYEKKQLKYNFNGFNKDFYYKVCKADNIRKSYFVELIYGIDINDEFLSNSKEENI